MVTSYLHREYNDFFVGFFALVVLSTVALQSIMMESKNKKVDKKLDEYIKEQTENRSKIRRAYETRISDMRDYISSIETENIILKENKKS